MWVMKGLTVHNPIISLFKLQMASSMEVLL